MKKEPPVVSEEKIEPLLNVKEMSDLYEDASEDSSIKKNAKAVKMKKSNTPAARKNARKIPKMGSPIVYGESQSDESDVSSPED